MAGARRRLSSADRRMQLIEVGRQTFGELGYERTSVEELARRAGITKPIIYEHFGGKEGLYATVVALESERVLGLMAQAIAAAGTPRQRMEEAFWAFLRYVRDEPDGFRVLARDAPASRDYAETLSTLTAAVGAVVAREFEAAGYDTSGAPVYACALIGMLSFVAEWWDEDRQLPIEEVVAHLSAMAWLGLRQLPARPDGLVMGRTPRTGPAGARIDGAADGPVDRPVDGPGPVAVETGPEDRGQVARAGVTGR